MIIVQNNRAIMILHSNSGVSTTKVKNLLLRTFHGHYFQVLNLNNTIRKIKDIVFGQQYQDGCIYITYGASMLLHIVVGMPHEK